MNRLTREQAIKEVGLEAVELVEGGSPDFTNRVTDGGDYHGYTEFSCVVDCKDADGYDVTLYMFIFEENELVSEFENLEDINWKKIIKDAEFEIM